MPTFLKLPSSLTLDEVMAAVERQHTTCDNPGFCLACGAETDGIEPDGRNYECDECGCNQVFGAEEILMCLDLRSAKAEPEFIEPPVHITVPTTQNKNFLRAIEKVRALGFLEPARPEIRTNPYTHLSHVLPPLAVMLYDFITTKTLVCGQHFELTTWNDARYAFQEMWPTEYFDLLD